MKRTALILIGCILLSGCKEKPYAKPIDLAKKEGKAAPLKTQDSSIKIIPIEHATAILEWNDITIYIDPVGGLEAFEGQKQPDLILITDVHGDHLSVDYGASGRSR